MDVSMAEFLQLTANGVTRGLFYAALGVGLALVLGVTGRFHFAYALTYTFATYSAFLLIDVAEVPFLAAAAAGVLAAVVLSVLIEVCVYRPVTAKAGRNALLVVIVTSLGITTAGVAALQLIAGTGSLPFYGPVLSSYTVGPVTVSNFDLYQALTSLALVLAVAALLARTRTGRVIKAVRSNPGLAQLMGISARRVHVICFAIAGLISGTSAIWYGLQYTVEPVMGDRVIIYAFVVAFLAGTRTSPLRALVVGLGISLLEQWASMFLTVQWSQIAVFTVLVTYLVLLAARGRWGRLL
jgi:branched-chain amino acid transport system permease protein